MSDFILAKTEGVVTRWTIGDYVDGDYADAVESSFSVFASFQWSVGRNLVTTEDREKTKTKLKAWADVDQPKLKTSELGPGAKRRADHVVWMGTTYKVTQARDWTWDTDGNPHMEYEFAELGLDETG